jgi:hypothetical protein
MAMHRHLSIALLVISFCLCQDAALGQSMGNDTAVTDYAWWNGLDVSERHDVVLGMIEGYKYGYGAAMDEIGSAVKSEKIRWRRKTFRHTVDYYVAAISDWYQLRAGKMNLVSVASVIACLADKPVPDAYCTYNPTN